MTEPLEMTTLFESCGQIDPQIKGNRTMSFEDFKKAIKEFGNMTYYYGQQDGIRQSSSLVTMDY